MSKVVYPKVVKPLIFLICLIPLISLIWNAFQGHLGANPIEKVTHITGEWALRFLLLTLSVTPARKLLGWHFLLRLRRMVGLYAFFYACLHFLTYMVLDQFFDFDEIIKDILKRPYITVGVAAFVLLIPLAVTSTNTMMKRLGRRWKSLHQLIYVIGVLAILHFLWLVKADNLEPLVYACILLVLFMARVWIQRREKPKQRPSEKRIVKTL
ncbi:MAG: protein-methionine-sulfoxide reductase heme-binding subunit MsrQ [Gammaproteobacteria bacterium]|jgi:sulfoxide reductase heme-binding subunit YedZ